MPPVRDLHCLRCPGRGTFGEERCSIAAAHLHPGPLLEPSREAGRLPVGQQVHWTPAFDVDQDGPVVAAFAGRVLIDADHPRDWNFGVGQRFDQPEHRAAAHGHAEDARQVGTGPTGEGEPDHGQRRPQALGPSAVPTGQAGQLFGEGPPPAGDDRAEEPAEAQTEGDPSASAGHISGKPQVGTVNPP